MKTIPVPRSNRTRALILVDLQPGFLKGSARPIVSNLKKLFAQESYDLYVEVTFHAERGSLWDRQTGWTFPYEPSTPEVTELLAGKKKVRIVKQTRSAFKGDKDLRKILKQKKIQEVHIAGLDMNDCVFATAQESFDLGFYTYVIEECTGSSEGKKLHDSAIFILRHLGLTNHS